MKEEGIEEEKKATILEQSNTQTYSTFIMGENGGRNSLPNSLKLKGEENYAIWKDAMTDLAKANGCQRYIHAKARPPKKVDEFEDDEYTTEELDRWQTWEAGNSSMMLMIRINVKETPQSLLTGCTTALDMWATLQIQYEGTGAVLNYNAIEQYTRIKYEDYTSLEHFIIAFKKSIEKLATLQISPPDSWHPLLFIMALSEEFPTWAERQRSNSRSPATSLSLAALIIDITDEARKKGRTIETGSALYGGRPNPNQKDRKPRKGKLCKNCNNPNAFHDPDKCFVTNHKLRKEWEKKNNKKFVLNTQKDNDNDSERSFANDLAMNICLSGIKDTEEGTLFDTGADQHFAKSADSLDEGTLIQATSKLTVNMLKYIVFLILFY